MLTSAGGGGAVIRPHIENRRNETGGDRWSAWTDVAALAIPCWRAVRPGRDLSWALLTYSLNQLNGSRVNLQGCTRLPRFAAPLDDGLFDRCCLVGRGSLPCLRRHLRRAGAALRTDRPVLVARRNRIPASVRYPSAATARVESRICMTIPPLQPCTCLVQAQTWAYVHSVNSIPAVVAQVWAI